MSKLLKIQPQGNFYIQEFVSPWWMKQASSPAHVLKGLQINNPAMIEGSQLIRDSVGESIKINDWHRGGSYEESGLRTPHTLSTQSFSIFSSHMFWKALDLKFASIDTQDVCDLIVRNPRMFHMIEAIEEPSATRGKHRDWLHVVFGYRAPRTQIKVFNP